MVDLARKIAINLMLGLIAVIVIVVAYSALDTELPSFPLAMWVIPPGGSALDHYPNNTIVAAETFTAREIFVRNRTCFRHIDHWFVQDGQRFLVDSPPNLWFPKSLGLQTQNWESRVPEALHTGPASYMMRLLWYCWENPLSWLVPYEQTLRYVVYIVNRDTQSQLHFNKRQTAAAVLLRLHRVVLPPMFFLPDQEAQLNRLGN